MGDDQDKLIRLWREKRGEIEPEDLSDNLIVQLGTITEVLNRAWYQRSTGQTIKDIQKRVRHPVHKWMAATLDGMVEQTGAVFEAKFMLPWAFTEEAAAEKHMAQLQHNMWVVGRPLVRALDHHRRRQMGRDQDPCRPALSASAAHRREEVLALRPERRTASCCSTSKRRDQGWRRLRSSICRRPISGRSSRQPICAPGTAHGEHELAKSRAEEARAGGCQGGKRARDQGQALQVRRDQLRRLAVEASHASVQ